MTATTHPNLTRLDAQAFFAEWLAEFGAALESGDAHAVAAFFDLDGTWRDVLSFTWSYRSFDGRAAIEEAFAATIAATRPTAFQPAVGRSPAVWVRRSGVDVVEGLFDFTTSLGRGVGFIRLTPNEEAPSRSTIAIGLTSLQELAEHPEQRGEHRPTGLRWSFNFAGDNWKDERLKALDLSSRSPEVLIVGAGQSGLALAARLKVLGIDAIVVESNARVGDNWRNRYHSLTLHNESWANSLPHMPFPDTWPTFVPKDKLADWLEYYAEAMEIDVLTSTRLESARRDEASGTWQLALLSNGRQVELSVPHVVWATGAISGAPQMPSLPGADEYTGEVVHSAGFLGGPSYAGRKTIVFGTGNSGHDVAQDLQANGAETVTLVQRGPTTVVSLMPSSTLIYAAYSERPTEDADFFVLSTPIKVLKDGYQRLSRRTRQLDADLLSRLDAVGFLTDEGADGTGWHMKYLSRGGGYYINVGAADLVASGDIGLIQASEIEGFSTSGLRLTNDRELEADLVVFATGFESMSSSIARTFGPDVSERVGPIWGLDEEGYLQGMWRRTGQDGFWIMGGSLVEARIWSRFLALQLVAAIRGGSDA